MQVFAAFISCATLLLPYGAQAEEVSTPSATVAWQAAQPSNDGSIIQRPAESPQNSSPLAKNAHEPALAEEEDPTGPDDDQALAQAVIHLDTVFALDASVPRLSPAIRLHFCQAPLALRC